MVTSEQFRRVQERPMFEDQAAVRQFNIDTDYAAVEPFDPREVIKSCAELPFEVRKAKFTQVEERLIDECLLVRLTNQLSLESNATDLVDRLQFRQESLSPYLGSILTRVFIRLPGVHYTIEIDPITRAIVHWEWKNY